LQQGTNADLIATNRGHLLVPQTPETFTYDADGNLTSDSLWTNTWDGENRRTVIESRSGVPAAARVRVQWTHLPDGRWIERIVSTNSGTAYQPAFTNRYVWDGNVLLAVLNHTNGLELSFLRGLDLSGTPQGAGGVGGLLFVGHFASAIGYHAVACDGNGNVTALVNAADGTESARYEFGPFGEPLRITGPMGKVNPLRFSTQFADDWTGDLKYLHRDYHADLGRWLSRDPIEEAGGMNVYGMLDNDPINFVDLYGLAGEPTTPPLKRPIPEKERGCCDDATVKKGEAELKNRYKKAADEAKKLGLKPASPPPWGSGPATCKNSSQDVLEYLVPTPACWQCYLEERNYYSPAKDPTDDRLDHQVVICVGYSASGSKKEIIFDWWGDTKHGDNQSGGPPDKFRKEYRYPQKITENPYWTRCSDGNSNKTPPPCSGWQCSRPPVYK
jgi:RHS repeat-associated protein